MRLPGRGARAHPAPAGLPDAPAEASAATTGPRATLLHVAAEAVILQDRADEVLDRIRLHHPLGQTAPPGGALVRRFFALADELPGPYDDPHDELLRVALAAILSHHAQLIVLAMELSAHEWRSERLRLQVESLTGTGVPGRRLEELYAELAHERDQEPA